MKGFTLALLLITATQVTGWAQLSRNDAGLNHVSSGHDQSNVSVSVDYEDPSIHAFLLSPYSKTEATVKGIVVDPQEPDFEMYTSKIVLLRQSMLPDDEAGLIETLKDIVSADPKAIVIISKNDSGEILGFPSFAIPILTIAQEDASEIILAVRTRRQVAIEIK